MSICEQTVRWLQMVTGRWGSLCHLCSRCTTCGWCLPSRPWSVRAQGGGNSMSGWTAGSTWPTGLQHLPCHQSSHRLTVADLTPFPRSCSSVRLHVLFHLDHCIDHQYITCSWCPMDSCTRGSGRQCSSCSNGQALEHINAIICHYGLHCCLCNSDIAPAWHRRRQVPQRPSLASPQSLHRQRAHSSAWAMWLDKGPVRNSGSTAHWPLSVAGGLLTPHRTPGTRDTATWETERESCFTASCFLLWIVNV